MKNIFAAIVTFRPTNDLIELIEALSRQSIHTLIVVNDTDGESEQVLCDLKVTPPSVIQNAKNMGVGCALNQALDYGKRLKFEWMITFDQDSLPLESYFAELSNHYEFTQQTPNAAVIAPTLITRCALEIRTDAYLGMDSERYFLVDTAVTSGSIYRIGAIAAVGGFASDYFIDYVDHEICLKLKRHDFLSFRSTGARVRHQIGSHRIIRIAGMNFSLTEYHPHRHYFIARNRILTYRRYIRQFPLWVIRDCLISVIWTFVTFAAEEHKAPKFFCFLLGSYDGIHGIGGNPRSYFIS